MFKKIIRKDGSTVILAPKRDTKAVTVQVMYKIGSRQEAMSINGGSHFVEHLMFKGTKKRPTTLDISKELDAVGAEYNAYTAKDRTAYYVRADSSHLTMAIDVLADMLRHSRFDPKEVEKERGVILEEIKMYEDNPIMAIEDVYESIVFHGTPLARLIIGPRENIAKKISRDDLFKHKKRWYYPGNMILGISGNFDEQRILKLLEKYFPVEKSRQAKAVITPAKLRQSKPRVKIVNKDTEQIQIMLGFPGLSMGHKDLPALALMTNVLGGTMSSRLFINIREKKGLCYFIRSGAESHEDMGSFYVRAGLDKKRIYPALKLIKAELNRLKTTGVTVEELKRAKDNLRGHTILRLEDSSEYLSFLQTQDLFRNKIETIDQKLAKIDKVTRAEVQAMAKKIILWSKSNLAVIGPYASDQEFMAILTTK